MAQSPAHKFGQIIGDVLEAATEPILQEFALQHNLFLDKKGLRPARKGQKVSWTDMYGNTHDLDFVLEVDGTPDEIGTPIAFIETAWRRYTKHSRNKAQEIQGAIQPLRVTFTNAAPFIGVILAGVFTEGALNQLRSLGFSVLYFPYETVVSAFGIIGIDADFNEQTPDSIFAKKIKAWNKLSKSSKAKVADVLVQSNLAEINSFKELLRLAVTRRIEAIRILPLHGSASRLNSIEDAIDFISKYDENNGNKPVVKYEIEILYSNGDCIKGHFAGKGHSIEFLRSYQKPALHPIKSIG